MAPMTGKAGVIGRAIAGGGVARDPIDVGTLEEGGGSKRTMCLAVEQKTGTARRGEGGIRDRGAEGIRAKEETVSQWAEATQMVNSKREQEDLLVNKVLKDGHASVTSCYRKLPCLSLLVLCESGCRCGSGTSKRGRRRRDSDVNGKEVGALRGWVGEIGGSERYADVGRACAGLGRRKVRSLNGDGVSRVSKTGEGSKSAEEGGESVTESIREGGLGEVDTREEVVTIWVEEFAAFAGSVVEFRREKRKAETTKECEAVGGGVKAVIFVLARETVKGKGHPWGREGRDVGVRDWLIGGGRQCGAVVKTGEVALEPAEIE